MTTFGPGEWKTTVFEEVRPGATLTVWRAGKRVRARVVAVLRSVVVEGETFADVLVRSLEGAS